LVVNVDVYVDNFDILNNDVLFQFVPGRNGPFTLSGFVTSLFFEILNCKSWMTANWKVKIPRLWPKSFWFRQKIYECQNKSEFCTFSWTKIFDLSFVLHEEIRNLLKIACLLNAKHHNSIVYEINKNFSNHYNS
jgi:hypothetical protein